MAIFGLNCALLVSLAIYIEVEWHMMAQNYTRNGDNNLEARKIVLA